MSYTLTVDSAVAWVNEHGLNPDRVPLVALELGGGISASVISVTGDGVGVVLKQSLPKLRVDDVWIASVDRILTESTALRLLGKLTPGAVPEILGEDRAEHVLALELLPSTARNWQSEIATNRVHPELGTWAGSTLGTWHTRTTDDAQKLASTLGSTRAFEDLRLSPFHETVMRRRPDLAEGIAPCLAELRTVKRCLVDGDYAPKNMLVRTDDRCCVVDLEVAHVGNPVFDVGFFLSFVILSAIRWPRLTAQLRHLGEAFLLAYHQIAGASFAGDAATVVRHTACLILARTDGLSPATFLDPDSRRRAREVGTTLLEKPDGGLWSWA